MSEELTLLQIRKKIFYADYFKENHKFEKFNFRKNEVTITIDFLDKLANKQYLTSDHFIFFQQLFQRYFGKNQILSLNCYFFTEFMPDLTQQLNSNIITSNIRNFSQPQQLNNQENQNQINTQENLNENQQKDSNNIFIKFVYASMRLLKKINPLALFQKSNQDQLNINPTEFEQQNYQKNNLSNQIISQKSQQELNKYNFCVQNVQVIQKDKGQINNKEIQFNNYLILPKEQGPYHYNSLQKNISQLCQIFSFNEAYNIFSLFEYTYIPINLQNNHWMCAVVSYRKRTIQYLDSYFQQSPFVSQGIQKMLNYKGENNTWQLTNESPKQQNSYDCGVFCLMALYNLYKTGQLITKESYNQTDIDHFRIQLLQLAIIESQIDINQKLLMIILDYKYK